MTLPPSLVSASPKRQAEYVAGRFAAMVALKQAGYTGAGEVSINPDRSPLWPEGFVGSITHTPGYVAAAVAGKDRVLALGMDSENPMTPEVASKVKSRIATENELQWIPGCGLSFEHALTLIFSAKESLYKALFPLVGRFFGFQDAQVTEVDFASGTLKLVLQRELSTEWREGRSFLCRFELSERIHTGIEVRLG